MEQALTKKEFLELIIPMFEELKYGHRKLEKGQSKVEVRLDRVEVELGRIHSKFDAKFDVVNSKIDMLIEVCQAVPNHEKRITDLEQNMKVVRLVIKNPKA
jgi:hypothetical protein